MRYRKVYGQSRVDKCPFCGKQAVLKNPQGIPVCTKHAKDMLVDLKCICGDWLDVAKGKFGSYFRCMKCGSVSLNKVMEVNPDIGKTAEKKEKPKFAEQKKEKPRFSQKPNHTPKEIVVTSDDVDIYFS